MLLIKIISTAATVQVCIETGFHCFVTTLRAVALLIMSSQQTILHSDKIQELTIELSDVEVSANISYIYVSDQWNVVELIILCNIILAINCI